MSWVWYALIAAFSGSAASLLEKKVLFKEHAMEFASVLAFFNLLFALPFFFFIDYTQLAFVPLLITFAVSVLATFAFLLLIKSVRHMEVSLVSPLVTIHPAVVALLGFVFLGERLTLAQAGGILLLLVGSAILRLQRDGQGPSLWHDFFGSKYIRFALASIFIYSVCAILDRAVLSRYDFPPEAYIAFIHLFIAFNFFVLINVFYDGIRDIRHGIKEERWLFPVIALAVFIHRLSAAIAMKAAYAGLVTSVAITSTFFTTLIGGELFHEKNVLQKTIASLIMLAGVALVVWR